MPKLIRIFLFLGLIIIGLVSLNVKAASPGITVITIKGAITPVLVDYITRGIDQAERDNAVAAIIQMDTSGGLDSAMRDIVQKIVNARVPVVVYVSPSGARAASAGVFITLSAHVAAMAPNTAIGAAHPVAIGEGGEQAMSQEMQEKVVNDAVAYIKSLATSHGRNADWAEKAVKESVSITEREALDMKVIEMIAPNLPALISQLDGRQVTMLDGKVVTLHTRGVAINRVDMSTVENFLFSITDPNIAYILLSIGMLGIIAEIFSPGLIFPGVIGGICLLLAVYALGMLSVNITGVLLIVLAFGLFVAEIFTPGFGLLAGGGLVSLIIGSLILFKGGAPSMRVDPGLIALVSILIVGFFAFVIQRVVKAHRQQASTGREGLVGRTAVVKEALDPEGMVFLEGERWTAIAEHGHFEPGEEVTVTKVEGLKLYVTAKNSKEVSK
ncbi:MAG: nodulation protein NfeD [Chloroflexi bacterium]|nr:nodulation protein NfeD [Chloroflexota bacterium]